MKGIDPNTDWLNASAHAFAVMMATVELNVQEREDPVGGLRLRSGPVAGGLLPGCRRAAYGGIMHGIGMALSEDY
jgi:hypothetical protein